MAQVGTFCIACAILTLPDVGPRDQPGQDPILLLTTVAAILWGAALTVATVACCVGMVALARRSRRRRPTSGGVALGVYVTAQVTPSPPSPSPHPNRGPEPAPDPSPCSNLLIQVAPAFLRTSVRLHGVGLASYHPLQVTSAVIGTSVSKMFALATESPPLLAVLIVIAIFFALVNVISLILAAKAVDQAPAPTSRST